MSIVAPKPILRRDRRAYSLIEIMVVISISCILLAMSIGGYRIMRQSNTFNNEVSEFANAFKEASILAKNSGRLIINEGKVKAEAISISSAMRDSTPKTLNGKMFEWRVYQNGQLKNSGRFASLNDITVKTAESASTRASQPVTVGSCLDIHEVTVSGSKLTTKSNVQARFMFRPDGSPLDPCNILVICDNRDRVQKITLEKFGGITSKEITKKEI